MQLDAATPPWQQAAAAELLCALRSTLDFKTREVAQRVVEAQGKAAAAMLQTWPSSLSAVECSCSIGAYTNAQVIGNLLHLVVQMALFRQPSASVGVDPPSEAEQRSLGWKHDADVSAQPAVSECGSQAGPSCLRGSMNDPFSRRGQSARPQSAQRSRSRDTPGGVRIGGGYHVIGKTAVRSNSSGAVSRVNDYRKDDEALHGHHQPHAFAHGAVPEGMPGSRYHVGMYSLMHSYAVEPARAGGLTQLYRVLSPAEPPTVSTGCPDTESSKHWQTPTPCKARSGAGLASGPRRSLDGQLEGISADLDKAVAPAAGSLDDSRTDAAMGTSPERNCSKDDAELTLLQSLSSAGLRAYAWQSQQAQAVDKVVQPGRIRPRSAGSQRSAPGSVPSTSRRASKD
eukprot:TRINITY_DN72147_c0_g1_i3.p1 TRINITY_DN72147_c0_g1~~TRINITY_DN72147_c0_g1_i3.p1  ORF type:complete len:399 (-),score=81.22 TRINITY_DN72147_c0_g1_i3:145-1341(-)